MGQQSGGNRDQGAGGGRFVQFSRGAAQRIANVVRTVEAGDRGQSGLTFDHPIPFPSKAANVFRVATFSGDWQIGTSKTVTFKNVTNTPNTAVATNLLWPVSDQGQRDCAIGKEGTAWYLLVPQMYTANAATAATLTTAALEFQTVPVIVLATSSTNKFSIIPPVSTAISDVTLGANGLVFTRKNVGVFFEGTASTVTIAVVTCSTATAG